MSVAGKDWNIRYSNGVPNRPSNDTVGWVFAFPSGHGCGDRKCAHVDYVTTNYGHEITAKSVTMTFAIEGVSPVFGWKTEKQNTCDRPAAVRVMIEKPGDQDLTDANGRFWSNPQHVNLALGFSTLTVPLDGTTWSNVFGEVNPSAFKKLLKKPGVVGMTFGGGCFFGHGVYVSSGSASFNLTSYSFQ